MLDASGVLASWTPCLSHILSQSEVKKAASRLKLDWHMDIWICTPNTQESRWLHYKWSALWSITFCCCCWKAIWKKVKDAFSLLFWKPGSRLLSGWFWLSRLLIPEPLWARFLRFLLTHTGSLLKITVIPSSAKIYYSTNKYIWSIWIEVGKWGLTDQRVTVLPWKIL